MEGSYRFAQGGDNIFPTSLAYKIFTRPVLWFDEAVFCQTKIGDLNDIANCVSFSSSDNVPQLAGSLDGSIFVPTYNWSEYFEDQTIKIALTGITQM